MIKWSLNNWSSIIILVLVYPMYRGIKVAVETAIAKIPDQIYTLQLEQKQHENTLIRQRDEQDSTKELQIDNYYRSVSGQKLEKLFDNWISIIADENSLKNMSTQKLTNMVKDLMMYGSAKSVKLGSIYMQQNYLLSNDSESVEPFVLLYLVAAVIASLKRDFTGHEVDPQDLILLKVKDINTAENQKKWKNAKVKAKKIIDENMKE